MKILGIESSCDETAAAVYCTQNGLLSNVIASQDEHIPFGGVVPEIASRAHTERILPIIRTGLNEAGITLDDVDAIACTVGPGLVGSLLVGVSAAKGLAFGRGLPVVPIHHIEAHIFANRIDHPELEPPFIALVVSGGHTQLIWVPKWGNYRILGTTRDDAAGEAYDKVAKLIGVGYPGGPLMDRMAKEGNAAYASFPRARIKGDALAFSFSGLKTAVLQHVEGLSDEQLTTHRADIAASFQDAVADALVDTSVRALRKMHAKRIVLAGGVASNSELRSRMEATCVKLGVDLFRPSPILCTDNAAMVACAGAFWHEQGRHAGLDLNPDPRLALPDLDTDR
jgi:N6-L-threonylcarbamoyladenine synthase